MTLQDKLKEYFEESGRQQMWIAKKLGLKRELFYNVTNGRYKLHKRYWSEIIRLTEGKITLADLLEQEVKDLEDIQIKATNNPEKCEVIIKIKKEMK